MAAAGDWAAVATAATVGEEMAAEGMEGAVLVGEGEEGEDAADAAVMAPGRRRRASV